LRIVGGGLSGEIKRMLPSRVYSMPNAKRYPATSAGKSKPSPVKRDLHNFAEFCPLVSKAIAKQVCELHRNTRSRKAVMGAPMKSLVVMHSTAVAGHGTSVSLEDAFRKVVREIAIERDIAPSDLIGEIDPGCGGVAMTMCCS